MQPTFDLTLLAQRLQHYAGAFECHITLDTQDLDRLQHHAEQYGCKLISIHLSAGDTPIQPMLCRRYRSPEQAYQGISHLLTQLAPDYAIVRLKVEAALNNCGIPDTPEQAQHATQDCYFEHHVKVRLAPEYDLQGLRLALQPYAAHLSRNALSRSTQMQTRFITQRCYQVDKTQATQTLAKLLAYLHSAKIDVLDSIQEYNIFDSNLALDKGWMSHAT